MARNKHPKKAIEAALKELETMGWQVEKATGGNAHCWGNIQCPANKGSECRTGKYCWIAIYSTPKVPEHHARELLQKAKGCLFRENIGEKDNG